MSKVSNSNNTIGQLFKPVITNITEETLEKYKVDNQSIGINNAFIISIPQDTNGDDLPGAGSIWLTDNDGLLYQLTKSINKS